MTNIVISVGYVNAGSERLIYMRKSSPLSDPVVFYFLSIFRNILFSLSQAPAFVSVYFCLCLKSNIMGVNPFQSGNQWNLIVNKKATIFVNDSLQLIP